MITRPLSMYYDERKSTLKTWKIVHTHLVCIEQVHGVLQMGLSLIIKAI